MNNIQTEKQEIWKQRLSDWQTSGLSQKEFCEKNGLVINTFHYWKRKIDSPSRIPAFVKINRVEKDNGRIIILHPAGVRLIINREVPCKIIMALLAILESY
jgi:hypothetical protein